MTDRLVSLLVEQLANSLDEERLLRDELQKARGGLRSDAETRSNTLAAILRQMAHDAEAICNSVDEFLEPVHPDLVAALKTRVREAKEILGLD